MRARDLAQTGHRWTDGLVPSHADRHVRIPPLAHCVPLPVAPFCLRPFCPRLLSL